MGALLCVLALALAQFSQTNTGELRLVVTDASGLPVQSTVELVSEMNQLRETLETTSDGTVVAKRLAFGTYQISVTHTGFAPFVGSVEIRSALPTEYAVTLSLAPLQAQVTVTSGDTLVDLHQVATVQHLGAETLQQRLTALPGRSLPDLVNTQPGWLLEANGVLHPRGSEYQTQYVIDGLPLTDNRSPAFAPDTDPEEVHSLSVLTGGYPAEYGRKLGGVIEVVTGGEARRGFHGSVGGSLGSFSTKSGDAFAGYTWRRMAVNFGAGVAATDRYLDPPVEENFTNHGRTSHATVHIEHDVTDADRFGIIVREGQSRFLVPNERVQEAAGQRQDRQSQETVGQFSYQHVFGIPLVADLRGMARDLSSGLTSNAAAIPILATQDRGIREGYVKGTVSAHIGVHEVKAGGDFSVGVVRERFAYQITDPSQFDPGTPPAFAFNGQQTDREQGLFIQDQIRAGQWTVNAGLRWDHYALIVHDSAISPRLGLAWSWPAAGLVLRASYDRAYQTPAVENLLLASSPAVDVLNDNVLRLPVPPSRGDFYEGAVSKALLGVMRLEASYFERHMSNFADDDLLLNTGVSFPIAFQHADIRGTEIKLAVPHWKRLSTSASYALQKGTGTLPITGGLFLGQDAQSLLASTNQFPVSQDQRHTVRGRLRCDLTAATWAALAVAYGSGLPVEFTGDYAQAVAQYGPRIVDQVDFQTGRVRPNYSLDGSVGLTIVKRPTRRLGLQVDLRNLTDHLNVINFAGLFSGTALAPPRSVAVRARADF